MRIFLTLFFILFAHCVLAQGSAELYRAEISVADHSVRQLDKASRVGLAQVLVKLSGSDSVLRDARIRDALAASKSYLQQYQYQRGDDGSLRVLIQFDQGAVMSAIADARLPLWAGQRPSVLIWIVLDTDGQRRFGRGDENVELVDAITDAFATRGVPVNFPLYDLQDSLSIKIHDLWELQQLLVYQASQRYQQSHILVARLTQDDQRRWLGDWMYLSENSEASTSIYGADADTVAALGSSLAVEAMAERYAVTPTDAPSQRLLVRVEGLERYVDYRRALTHLQQLELVQSAQLEVLSSGTGIFRVQAPIGETQLQQVLEQTGKMQPVSTSEPLAETHVDPRLVYRWLQ